MGKASRWFRNLLGLKQRPDPNPNTKPPSRDKTRWSFVKSCREKSRPNTHTHDDLIPTTHHDAASSSSDVDATKHAIAVAAATAAVAEAAISAAHAASAVVQLTNNGRCSVNPQAHVRQGWAAVVIQSHFRGFLARRALRALKGLVKLQALVRGHLMRKRTAKMIRCLQALLQAQARARSVRAYIPESPSSSSKSSQIQHPGPPTPEKFEQVACAKNAKHDPSPKIRRNGSRSNSWVNTPSQERVNIGSSWSDPWMDEARRDSRGTSSARTCMTDDDRADRILEIDTENSKPRFTLRRRSLFESSNSGLLTMDQGHHTVPSHGSCEVAQSLHPVKLPQEVDDVSYCTAETSPQLYSVTSDHDGSGSRRGSFTPAKSDGSRSLTSGWSDCPSYMASTESARAKMRSLSAPKQRPQYERLSSTKRYSVHGFGEHNTRPHGHMHASFTAKAYPGSGRLDRLGMPFKDSAVVYYSGYLN